MKILTIVGTRPELIRLSVIISKLDNLIDHVLVYTNQNYDYNLSQIFFDELKIRKPNYTIQHQAKSFGDFLSNSIIEIERILFFEKPDKILILGDTNSGLLGIVAERYKIPVYHMEAGNRCYDDKLPEETNRKIIDSFSKYNLPYTENSKNNLLKEGYHKNFVLKTGNPIFEVLSYYSDEISKSNIINKLQINVGNFVLVTLHRSENVDDLNPLKNIINALNVISEERIVVLPLHPRTKDKIEKYKIQLSDNIKVINPVGFFDFITLEKKSLCVISDSGTVQEECCIFGIPTITIRNSTERQETIECGSNILAGTDTDRIIETYNIVKNRISKWNIPEDYLIRNVSDIIINILISK